MSSHLNFTGVVDNSISLAKDRAKAYYLATWELARYNIVTERDFTTKVTFEKDYSSNVVICRIQVTFNEE